MPNKGLVAVRRRSDPAVPSPTVQEHDHVLDSTEDLVAQDGIEAVTIRALTKATGVSNGAIYRTFSRAAGMLGRAGFARNSASWAS